MASCGPTNAATQLSKLVNTDNSLHHERMQNNPQSNAGIRGDPRQMAAADRQLLESMQSGRPDPLRFDSFRQEVPVYAPQGPQNANWAQEFQNTPASGTQTPTNQIGAPSMPGSSWAQEFQTAPAPQASFQPFRNTMGFRPMQGMSMQSMSMPSSQLQASQQNTKSAQWDAVFDKLEQEQSTRQNSTEAEAEATSEAKTETGATATATATANATETVDQVLDRLMSEQEEEALENKYEEFNAGYQKQSFPPNWDRLWDTINTDMDTASGTNLRTEDFKNSPGTYRFSPDNPYQSESDPFEMGVYLMDNGAKLSTAILCFEEAVRRDVEHVEAWARLGMAHAQNEVESQAIVALERAVSLNPQHERALLNLAISYTNEGYDNAATQLLDRWVQSRYPEIYENTPRTPETRESERLMEMFLKAARLQGAEMDTDVQTGLGVLCYHNDEFDKAIDCFRSAVAATPNDASLWNRLGATVANHGRPEEAIEAYERALSLRPSFVRARYNIAVSCINIGCYREAAEHLLSALALHETEEHQGVESNSSSVLVDSLRRVFFAMDRRDLLKFLQPGTDLQVFKKEFNF